MDFDLILTAGVVKDEFADILAERYHCLLSDEGEVVEKESEPLYAELMWLILRFASASRALCRFCAL